MSAIADGEHPGEQTVPSHNLSAVRMAVPIEFAVPHESQFAAVPEWPKQRAMWAKLAKPMASGA